MIYMVLFRKSHRAEMIVMPRKAREKSPESIYHIMCRSISEIPLFRDDDDKDYYLALIKRYTDKYRCVIYAYCLMDTHLHLHLDPRGFDISKFMHSLNTVCFVNRKCNKMTRKMQHPIKPTLLNYGIYNYVLSFRLRSA